MRVITLLCCLASVLACRRESDPVSAEELLRHPKRYAGRTVRVDGAWASGFESSHLFITNSQMGYRVWVTLDTHSLSNASPVALSQIKAGLAARDRSRPTAVKIHFRGLCHFESQFPGAMDGILAFGESRLGISALRSLRKPMDGFGHMGGSQCELTIPH
jgi:hypothetical protein